MYGERKLKLPGCNSYKIGCLPKNRSSRFTLPGIQRSIMALCDIESTQSCW